MGVNGMYLLSGGVLEDDKGIMTYRVDMGKRIQLSLMMVLVKTDDGNILFDTGLNPHGLKDPIKTWGEGPAKAVVKFSPEDDVRNRLEELDLKTDDIRYVVNSHLIGTTPGKTNFLQSQGLSCRKRSTGSPTIRISSFR